MTKNSNNNNKTDKAISGMRRYKKELVIWERV